MTSQVLTEQASAALDVWVRLLRGHAALTRRKPQREVVNDTGHHAGFGDAEQNAQHVELSGRTDEHHRRAYDSPRNGDPGDPPSSAHLGEDEIARDLEQPVPNEKDSRAETIGGGAEPEVAVHVQRRDPKVRAVDRIEQVERGEEREQSYAHAPHGGLRELTVTVSSWHAERFRDCRSGRAHDSLSR